MNPEKRTLLPKMAFTGFAARYREPKVEEGFQDITKVDFKVGVLLLYFFVLLYVDVGRLCRLTCIAV